MNLLCSRAAPTPVRLYSRNVKIYCLLASWGPLTQESYMAQSFLKSLLVGELQKAEFSRGQHVWEKAAFGEQQGAISFTTGSLAPKKSLFMGRASSSCCSLNQWTGNSGIIPDKTAKIQHWSLEGSYRLDTKQWPESAVILALLLQRHQKCQWR